LLIQKILYLLDSQYSILVSINFVEFLLKLLNDAFIFSLAVEVAPEYAFYIFFFKHHSVGKKVRIILLLGILKLQLVLV